MRKILIIAACALSIVGTTTAQEAESSVSFETGFDAVSRYIWRGLQFSDSPNVQPYMSVGYKGLSLTGWGSYALGNNYAEIDLYLSYTTHGLTLSLNDYFTEDETDLSSTNWRNWKAEETVHLVEACVSYTTLGENHPLTLTASTLIYGADDLDETAEQRYSTYFEASYPFALDDYEFALTLGGTATDTGYYASHAGVVNVGVAAVREIKVNEHFAIPLSLAMIYNPENDDSFFVLKLSF